jgi:hypothetical protein
VRSRRAADEHASQTLLEKARLDKIPKHDPAHLSVETCHLSGISGGEPDTRSQHEQTPETRERFVETPCLECLRHLRCSSQFPGGIGVNETTRRAKLFVDVGADTFAHRPPRASGL